MFRKLCGDKLLKNTAIVTNMWEEVDAKTGDMREAELIKEEDFFKPVLDKGAWMARHDNTVFSGAKILLRILKNNPLPLRIQEELVKQHKDISETSAGEELNRGINAQIKKHQEKMRILREEMERVMKDELGDGMNRLWKRVRERLGSDEADG